MKLGFSDMTRISKSEDDDWMNDTQSGGVSGVVVEFLLEVGRLRLLAVTCTLPLRCPLSLCSGDGRLFQGGVVRISWLVKNVYIASPLISNRPLFPACAAMLLFKSPGSVLLKRLCWQSKCVCSGSVESAASGRLLAGNRSQSTNKSATDLL